MVPLYIAIENYFPKQRNQISPVKYAANDAEIFKNMLTTKMKVEVDDIVILKNEQAIKTEIEDIVKYQLYSLTENDRFVFYFVGHGFHNGVTNYISTYDMSKTEISNTAISLRQLLLDPLKKSKCKNALIFIDACAETLIDEYARNNISNINEDEFRMLSFDLPNYAVFLSCQDGEKSYSCDHLSNGIWTYHLVEALENNLATGKSCKYITDRKLSDYLSYEVSKYAKEKHGWSQNPKAILDSSYENILIEIHSR